jgi:hypothetical protein
MASNPPSPPSPFVPVTTVPGSGQGQGLTPFVPAPIRPVTPSLVPVKPNQIKPITGLKPVVSPTKRTTAPKIKGPSDKFQEYWKEGLKSRAPSIIVARGALEAEMGGRMISNAIPGIATFFGGLGADVKGLVYNKLIRDEEYDANTMQELWHSIGRTVGLVYDAKPGRGWGARWGDYWDALESGTPLSQFLIEDIGNITIAGGLVSQGLKRGAQMSALGSNIATTKAMNAGRVSTMGPKLYSVSETMGTAGRAVSKAMAPFNKAAMLPIKPWVMGAGALGKMIRRGAYLGNGYLAWGEKAAAAYRQRAASVFDRFKDMDSTNPEYETLRSEYFDLTKKAARGERFAYGWGLRRKAAAVARSAKAEYGRAARAVQKQVDKPLHLNEVDPETGVTYGPLDATEQAAVLAVLDGHAQLLNELSKEFGIPLEKLTLLSRYDAAPGRYVTPEAAAMAAQFLDNGAGMSRMQYDRLATAAKAVATEIGSQTNAKIVGAGRVNPLNPHHLVPVPVASYLRDRLARAGLIDLVDLIDSAADILDLPIDDPRRMAFLQSIVDVLPEEIALDPMIYPSPMRPIVEAYRRIRRNLERGAIEEGTGTFPRDPKSGRPGAARRTAGKFRETAEKAKERFDRISERIARLEEKHSASIEQLRRMDLVEKHITEGATPEQLAAEFNMRVGDVNLILSNSRLVQAHRRMRRLYENYLKIQERASLLGVDDTTNRQALVDEMTMLEEQVALIKQAYDAEVARLQQERAAIDESMNVTEDEMDNLSDDLFDAEDDYVEAGGNPEDLNVPDETLKELGIGDEQGIRAVAESIASDEAILAELEAMVEQKRYLEEQINKMENPTPEEIAAAQTGRVNSAVAAIDELNTEAEQFLGGGYNSGESGIKFYVTPLPENSMWEWWYRLDPKIRRRWAMQYFRGSKYMRTLGTRGSKTSKMKLPGAGLDQMAEPLGLTPEEWGDKFIDWASRMDEAKRELRDSRAEDMTREEVVALDQDLAQAYNELYDLVKEQGLDDYTIAAIEMARQMVDGTYRPPAPSEPGLVAPTPAEPTPAPRLAAPADSRRQQLEQQLREAEAAADIDVRSFDDHMTRRNARSQVNLIKAEIEKLEQPISEQDVVRFREEFGGVPVAGATNDRGTPERINDHWYTRSEMMTEGSTVKYRNPANTPKGDVEPDRLTNWKLPGFAEEHPTAGLFLHIDRSSKGSVYGSYPSITIAVPPTWQEFRDQINSVIEIKSNDFDKARVGHLNVDDSFVGGTNQSGYVLPNLKRLLKYIDKKIAAGETTIYTPKETSTVVGQFDEIDLAPVEAPATSGPAKIVDGKIVGGTASATSTEQFYEPGGRAEELTKAFIDNATEAQLKRLSNPKDKLPHLVLTIEPYPAVSREGLTYNRVAEKGPSALIDFPIDKKTKKVDGRYGIIVEANAGVASLYANLPQVEINTLDSFTLDQIIQEIENYRLVFEAYAKIPVELVSDQYWENIVLEIESRLPGDYPNFKALDEDQIIESLPEHDTGREYDIEPRMMSPEEIREFNAAIDMLRETVEMVFNARSSVPSRSSVAPGLSSVRVPPVPDPTIPNPEVQRVVYENEVTRYLLKTELEAYEAAQTVKEKLKALDDLLTAAAKNKAAYEAFINQFNKFRQRRAHLLAIPAKISAERAKLEPLQEEIDKNNAVADRIINSEQMRLLNAMPANYPLSIAMNLGDQYPTSLIPIEMPDGSTVRPMGPGYVPGGTRERSYGGGALGSYVDVEGMTGFRKPSSEKMRVGDRQNIFNMAELAMRMAEEGESVVQNSSWKILVSQYGQKAADVLGDDVVASLKDQASREAENLNFEDHYAIVGDIPPEDFIAGVGAGAPGTKNPAWLLEAAKARLFGEKLADYMKARGLGPVDPYRTPGTRFKGYEIGEETMFAPDYVVENVSQIEARLDPENLGWMMRKATAINKIWKGSTLAFSIMWQIGDLTTAMIIARMTGIPFKVMIERMKQVASEEYTTRRSIYDPNVEVGSGPYTEVAFSSPVQDVSVSTAERAFLRNLPPLTGKKTVLQRMGRVGRPIETFAQRSFKLNETINRITRHAFFLEKLDRVLADLGTDLDTVVADGSWKTNAAIREAVNDAAISANRWLGDFADLSARERRYVSLVFPFYAWTKHIHKVFYALGKEHPQSLTYYMYMGTLGADTEEDPLDLRLGTIPVFGGAASVNFLNPLADVVEGPIGSLLLKGDPRKIGSMTGPVIRVPAAGLGVDTARLDRLSRPAGTGMYTKTGMPQPGLFNPSDPSTYSPVLGYGIQQFPIANRLLNLGPVGGEIPGTNIATGPVLRYATGEARTIPGTDKPRVQPGGRIAAVGRLFSVPGIPSRSDEQLADVYRSAKIRLRSLETLKKRNERDD